MVQAKDDLRGLKILVSVLGVAIVLGTTVIIGTIISRLYAKPAAPSIAAPAAQVAPAAPPAGGGPRIAGMAAVGGKLAVWLADGQGGLIEIIDPATGQITARIRPDAKSGTPPGAP
ncbi:MAG TPA: DUF6476 family protein [Acetobacteraceae bacterium]|nr:DUF6476 family protein [Acetobacteraceae bacterium]